MRAIIEKNQYGLENVTWVSNDKVVLLHADVAPEEKDLLKKWQEEKLIPCVLVLGDNAKAIICDKNRFYLNEEDYIFRESEREKLLEQIRNNCSAWMLALGKTKVNGDKHWHPHKRSWDSIAQRYVNICHLVLPYFGEDDRQVGEDKR